MIEDPRVDDEAGDVDDENVVDFLHLNSQVAWGHEAANDIEQRLDIVRNELRALRALRERINERVAYLVHDEETLSQAHGVFVRRRDRTPD